MTLLCIFFHVLLTVVLFICFRDLSISPEVRHDDEVLRMQAMELELDSANDIKKLCYNASKIRHMQGEIVKAKAQIREELSAEFVAMKRQGLRAKTNASISALFQRALDNSRQLNQIMEYLVNGGDDDFLEAYVLPDDE